MTARLFLIGFIFSFSTSLVAEPKKTKEQYWKDTELELELTERFINDQDCYAGAPRTHVACVFALKQAVSYASEGEFVLSTKSHMKRYPSHYGAVEKDFGEAVIVKSAFKPEGSVLQMYKATKVKFEMDLEVVLQLFQRGVKAYDSQEIMSWIERNYLNAENEAAVTGESISKMYKVMLDPHSYLTPKGLIDHVTNNSTQRIFGIGVSLTYIKDLIIIQGVVENGPAEKAGMKAGDVITHINDQAVKDLGRKKAMVALRGERGSKVNLTVDRAGDAVELVVIRDEVVIENVQVKTIENANGKYGYLKLRSFMPADTCGKMLTALEDFESQADELLGIIFDLRGNGGGRLDFAACIMGMLVGEDKTVITAQDIRTGRILQTVKSTEKKVTSLPIAVLINSSSASASEIVAGALKDYERAYVVGETSFGKGTVQGLRVWNYNTKVMNALTMSRFHMPSGWSNQNVGVTPDIETYRRPNPTDMDKFAIRESDEFLPVPAGDKKYEASAKRKRSVAAINRCLTKEDAAERAFERMSNDFYSADYQLLQAQDTLFCKSQ